MEEIEITSWLTLDAIKKEATIIETIGDLQTGHCMAVFCIIEDDFFELCYSDSISNFMRRFEDREEFELDLEKRKKEFGEAGIEDVQPGSPKKEKANGRQRKEGQRKKKSTKEIK